MSCYIVVTVQMYFVCITIISYFFQHNRNITFDKDITPYIHVFIYHVHYFAEHYGCLKAFEMEAVEQLNYVNKLVFFRASNHGKEGFTVTEQIMRNTMRSVVAAVEGLKRTKRHYASRKSHSLNN